MKAHLTEPEHLEQATIKKRKLQLKDRMEDIVRRVAAETGRRRSPPSADDRIGARHAARAEESMQPAPRSRALAVCVSGGLGPGQRRPTVK